MPSSFMVKRNYAHCPLKKRPLALYNEPATPPEQDEPEDLSVKRPRYSSPPPPEVRIPSPQPALSSDVTESYLISSVQYIPKPVVSTMCPEYPSLHPVMPTPQFPVNTVPVQQNYYYTPSQNVVHPNSLIPVEPNNRLESVHHPHHPQVAPPRSPENLPSLAEYYLQLFRKTSEAETKTICERPQAPLPWQSSTYLPPSPQNSPVSQESLAPPPTATHFYSPQLPAYPESSALISPVSTYSSTASESEDDSCSSQTMSAQQRLSRHSCDSCGKSYSTQSGLRKHSELHCSSLFPRAFSCKHCSKAYTSIGALKMHVRTHTLPCKCHVCGKAFSRPWLLQGHIRTHTGEKPFECLQCHRSFADRSNLRAHQQTHERIKKYACQTCKKTFSRMSLLNKHSENACMGVKFTSSPAPSPCSQSNSPHLQS